MSKILKRRARHGSWAAWRLLVAARVIESVDMARRFCAEGRVTVEDHWTIDERTYLPVGFYPLNLNVSGLHVRVYGVAGDDDGFDSLPEADTTGGPEPPIPGARLIIPKPSDLKRKKKIEVPRSVIKERNAKAINAFSPSSSSSSSSSSDAAF